jgi:hypothetical protein
MATLVITINGPFAYVDTNPASGYITLMAPMCPQHKAGIASIEVENQIILPLVNCRNHGANLSGCAPHRYELRPGLGQLNSAEWKEKEVYRVFPNKPFDPREWRFWLTLPRPHCFEKINPVLAYIIQPGVNAAPQRYAIGVRLIYTSWDGNDIPLSHEGGPVPDPNGNPFVFKFKKDQNDFAFLEIDYASPLRDDLDHEDAVDCFENLMNALGLAARSIYIPKNVPPVPPLPDPPPLNPPSNNAEASRLNDCQAAIAWIG